MKKLIIIAVSVALVVVLFISILGYWFVESYDNIIGSWKVENILLNGKDVTGQFVKLRVVFLMEGNNIDLPGYKKSPNRFMQKSYWKYRRTKWYHAQIEIYKTDQGFFDGIYEIEILDHRKPQLMRLYSDSIELYLREQYFSLEKPYIEFEFHFPDSSRQSVE